MTISVILKTCLSRILNVRHRRGVLAAAPERFRQSPLLKGGKSEGCCGCRPPHRALYVRIGHRPAASPVEQIYARIANLRDVGKAFEM